jgi:hypothetical protein
VCNVDIDRLLVQFFAIVVDFLIEEKRRFFCVSGKYRDSRSGSGFVFSNGSSSNPNFLLQVRQDCVELRFAGPSFEVQAQGLVSWSSARCIHFSAKSVMSARKRISVAK